MTVCFLTPRFPYPENGGDVLRINAIAKYLKNKNINTILISFCDKKVDNALLEQVHSLYDEVFYVKRNKIISLINSLLFLLFGKPIQCGYYFSFTFLWKFRKILKNYKIDLFIPHLLRMVPYINLLKLNEKTIVEMTDALSKTYSLSTKSNSFSLKKMIYKFERKKIKVYEQRVIQKFKKIVLVSENDIEYLGASKNLVCHTNGIRCNLSEKKINMNKICFVGNMRTLQNQNAVLTFLKNIFPKVKEMCPDAEFHIVGAEPPKSILKYEDKKNVFVTGFIDSIDEYLQDCCVLVAPVYIAAGIQNKVLIGMANGIPVILTPLIASAISGVKNNRNCIICEKYSEFADNCVMLMKDFSLRNEIGRQGFELMKNDYSWEKVLNGYEII